ncbi:MAG: helix-turn-helix transcriptional regulator [Candidatus Omnitrophica bacterium]|nr:helix-turn-helix transcriptional regulator [Candidatus Omnitrophota bacterium]MBU1128730.1 helix-turn-helix transcriptional regulator [Candidatus Omnitrophota bacterium]
MKGARRFKDRLKRDLKDPEFRKAFEEEEVYATVAIQIAKMREKEDLTQKELAKRLHTTQQTVSRLEETQNRSYSLKTLIKVARVCHKKIKIEFVG